MESIIMAIQTQIKVILVYNNLKLTSKAILLLTLVFIRPQVNAQLIRPAGLYFGGISYGVEQNGIGYYYFSYDSSFVFLNTTVSNSKGRLTSKSTYSDTIASYGKGKWSIVDSFFVIKFKKVDNLNVYNDTVKYMSYSKYPYDSLFLKIHVVNFNKETNNSATITLPDKNIGSITDTNGISITKLPLAYIKYPLHIYKNGFVDKVINLHLDNNVHDIVVNLASTDNCETIYILPEYSFPSKIIKLNNGIKKLQQFNKDEAGIEKMKRLVENSYAKFPMQKYFLDKIMEELKNMDK